MSLTTPVPPVPRVIGEPIGVRGELIQRNIQTNHNSNNRAANDLTPHGTTHCTMLKVQANVSLKWT